MKKSFILYEVVKKAKLYVKPRGKKKFYEKKNKYVNP